MTELLADAFTLVFFPTLLLASSIHSPFPRGEAAKARRGRPQICRPETEPRELGFPDLGEAAYICSSDFRGGCDTLRRKRGSSSCKPGPAAISPSRREDLLLKTMGEPFSVSAKPPAASTRATPPAISYSCLGENVQVAYARPADKRASL